MIRGKIKSDNGGMSLIEIIIAVTILGIITVPLLNLFVTSANLTFKAKKTGLATTAATSIYEKVKAAPISILREDAGTDDGKAAIAHYFEAYNGGDLSVSQTSVTKGASETDPIRNQNIHITDMVEGGRHYDADISIEAAPDTSTGSESVVDGSDYTNSDIVGINSSARTNPMSFNAIWLQPDGDNDPDKTMLSKLPSSVETDPANFSGTQEKIIKNVRKITIDLGDDLTDANYFTSQTVDGKVKSYVTAKITYWYDIEWKQKIEGTANQYETKKLSDVASGVNIVKEAGTNYVGIYDYFPTVVYKTDDKPQNFDLILFYNPYYGAYDSLRSIGRKDDILINNKLNLSGNIYIIKKGTEADNSITHSGIIELREKHNNADDPYNLKVHTNMGLAISTSGKGYGASDKNRVSGIYTLVREYANNRYSSRVDLTDTSRDETATTIINQGIDDHLYIVKVTIYDHEDNSKLYELSGIKKI